jgi:hypothetical protein
MHTLVFHGNTIPFRRFELRNPDGRLVQYNIAKESLEESLQIEPEDIEEGSEDLELDGNFYWYVRDEDFDLPASELFDIIRETDDYYTFVREV